MLNLAREWFNAVFERREVLLAEVVAQRERLPGRAPKPAPAI